MRLVKLYFTVTCVVVILMSYLFMLFACVVTQFAYYHGFGVACYMFLVSGVLTLAKAIRNNYDLEVKENTSDSH
jgi:hypothetical protein